jgi:hypothetical protein
MGYGVGCGLGLSDRATGQALAGRHAASRHRGSRERGEGGGGVECTKSPPERAEVANWAVQVGGGGVGGERASAAV